MHEFHLKNKILGLLGTLWEKNYANNAAFHTVVEANLDLFAQAKIDAQEAVDCVDRHTVPLFHTELWLPIRIREGKELQIANLRELPLLCNRLTSPSLVWHSGIDYEVTSNGHISFKRDPVADPLVPVDDENGYREAVLWGYAAKFERNYMADHFGYLVALENSSSQAYKDLLNAIFDQMAFGITLPTLEACLNAILGIPLAQKDGEVVEGLYFDARGPFVATDDRIYRIPSECTGGAKLRVIQGHALNRGEPVYKEAEILIDRTVQPFCATVQMSKDRFDKNLLSHIKPTEFLLRFE